MTTLAQPPTSVPAPAPKRRPRVGRTLAVVSGLALAYFVGVGVGHSGQTVEARPAAQPAPVVITRDVPVPGPTVTVPGPTVTVPGPTVTVEAPAPATAPEPAVGATFSAGTYEVGTEIKPGTYKTTGSSFCYFERLKDLNGDLDSIVTNEIVNGQGSMKVASSDKYVKFDGSCTWTKQ
ncbi:hypothetical protein [Actinomycetospora sp.]|uniref:hypothetical protein n=1 Tax=Actinomycetospora sp. TaxID=1872135 RepID=UPI002F4194C7